MNKLSGLVINKSLVIHKLSRFGFPKLAKQQKLHEREFKICFI
jgi:hypothetical protein